MISVNIIEDVILAETMAKKAKPKFKRKFKILFLILSLSIVFFAFSIIYSEKLDENYSELLNKLAELNKPKYPLLDKVDYDNRVFNLANISEYIKPISSSTKIRVATTTASTTSPSTLKYYVTSWGKFKMKSPLWPASTTYPGDGAILPFKRIIAYYGNFYSKNMGILGEYPEDEVLSRLQKETDAWNLADPKTPALPAIHYIAVTAQGSAGYDGKYRARMQFDQIDKAIRMAKKVNGIVFLDIQVALSNVQTEIPLLEKYLKMPQVHLAIDPEFSMKDGSKPGRKIGTMDAKDINYAIEYLKKLVVENDLPPKILIVHRFTEEMMTNYKNIEIVPEVQIVINMDGWGTPTKKLGTYQYVVYQEPVQFTGFKLFYKNDTKTGTSLMTPEQLLKITPIPIYIQYQ